jgi:DNA ligase (NAD+)
MPGGEPAFEGLGERSARNLLRSIDESKNVGLRRAIVGWSIPLCSEGTAKRLCRAGYESVEQIQAATFEELQEVEDIGPEVASSLMAFLAQPSTQEEIRTLRAAGVNLDVLDADRPVKAASSPLAGKSIVITGTLSKGRKEVQADLEAAGAKASSSISAKTDYLVVGADAGSKFQKAQKLGVTVLTEAEVYALLGRS